MSEMLFKRIKDWVVSITSFRTGDVIPVDGPSGTAKMAKNDLLKETAQNALAGNVAPAFDPTRTNDDPYLPGQYVVFGGKTYVFNNKHTGAWNASHVETAVAFDEISKCASEENLELINGVPVYYQYSQFAMGSTSSSGEYQPASTTRITTPTSLIASETFTIKMASGYRVLVHTNKDGTWTSSGWNTKWTIEKGAIYKVTAGRSDDSGVVTVSEVLFKIMCVNSVADLGEYAKENIGRIDNLLKNVVPKDVKPDVHFTLGSLNTSNGAIQENGHRISMDDAASFDRIVKVSHDFSNFAVSCIYNYDEVAEEYKSSTGWQTAPFYIPENTRFQLQVKHVPTEDYNVSTPIVNDNIYKGLAVEFDNEIVSKTFLNENYHLFTSVDYDVPDYVKGLVGNVADFRQDSETKVDDVYSWFDGIMQTFPNLITREQIATTSTPTGSWAEQDPNTYPIYCYTIKCKSTAFKKIIIACGIHGADPDAGDPLEGIVACAYFIRDLMFSQKLSQQMLYIRDNCEILLVPMMNPWGIQNDSRGNGRGVDCNRNFDINFVADQPSYVKYTTGPSAFSENETAAIRDLLADNLDAKFFIDVHARMDETIVNDTRWLTIAYDSDTGLNDVLTRSCNLMIDRYGGAKQNTTHTSQTSGSTSAGYASFVKGIVAYTAEFFRSNNLDTGTLDSVWVEWQCVNWFGVQLQLLVDKYCK